MNKSIQVISEITKHNFYVTPVGVYSRPRAQLLLSHICISVLAILSNIDCFAILLHNCSVDMNDFVLYQHFIFSEFNRSWMFSKQFLPIAITLQGSMGSGQLAKIGRAPWISRQGPWTTRRGELSRVPPQSKTARQKCYCTDFHYKTSNFSQNFVPICFI